MKAIKIFGLFILCVLILSVQINDKPIFSHIYKIIAPATKYTQRATTDLIKTTTETTKSYSKKIFENSVPKVKDSISSKQSGVIRDTREPQERITEEDREELNSLIKNH